MGRAVGVDPNVASALRGFYGEAGYRVISGASYRRRRPVRALRELRHAVQDADGLSAAERVRSRRAGVRRHVLARPRHRGEVRLLRREEQELDDHRCRTRSISALDGGSDDDDIDAVGRSSCRWRCWLRAPTGASTGARQQKPQVVEIFGRALQLHAVGVPREGRRSGRDPPAQRRHRSWVPDSSAPTSTSRFPKRGKGVATVTFAAASSRDVTSFECSKLCGAGHSFMRGTLIAE